MNIDCKNSNEYIRLFTNYRFNISDMMISDLTIEVGGEDEQRDKVQREIKTEDGNMCEYCKKIINNKRILDIDNEEETYMEIINQKKSWGYMLYVEIEGQDNDGYKPSQFFQINYCPMCGRKLVKE